MQTTYYKVTCRPGQISKKNSSKVNIILDLIQATAILPTRNIVGLILFYDSMGSDKKITSTTVYEPIRLQHG